VPNEITKSGWKRPENYPIYGIAALAGLWALQYVAQVMTWIRTILEQGVIALAYLGIAAVLVFLFLNQDLHKLVWLAYTSAIRWLMNRVYRIFPIEIMEDYVEELQGKQESLKEGIGKLRGQLKKNEALVAKKTAEHTQALRLAKEAHRLQAANAQAGQSQNALAMQMEFSLQARKAGRLEKSTMTYQGLINTLKRVLAMMEKVLQATNFMILDLQDTVADEKEKRATAHETVKVVKFAQAILGPSERRRDFDAALEANTQDYYEKMGLVDQFAEETATVFNTLDLEQGIYDADALEKIEQLGQQLTTRVFQGGTGKTQYRIEGLPELTSGGLIIEGEFMDNTGAEPAAVKRQSYADLFELDGKKS